MQRTHIILTTLGGLLLGTAVIVGFVLAGPGTPRSLPAQQVPQITRADVVAALQAIESAPNEAERWARAGELAALGQPAARLLVAEIGDGEATTYRELTRVAAYRALYDMQDPLTAADKLLDAVVHFESLEARRAAAQMLPQVCSIVHEARLKRMLASEGDEAVFDEQIQIAVCRALWFACKETRTSIPHLRRLMNSALFSVRMDALMAYAEIGRYDEVEEELRTLSREPSDRGRTARQLLAQMRLRRQLERVMLAMGAQPEGRIEDPAVSLRIVQELVQRIQDMAAVDAERLTTEALLQAGAERMLDTLDPYAAFLPTDEHIATARENLNQLAMGEPNVGLVVGRPQGLFRVIAVMEGSAAADAGLMPGDSIFEVDGVDVLGKSLIDLSARLKGEVGQFIDVQVARPGWSVPRTFHLEVRQLEPMVVRHTLLPGRVGYVYTQTLVPGSAAATREAVAALVQGGARSLVLDVRGNPGGSFDEAVRVAELFLPAGTLVAYSEGRNPEVAPRTEYRTEAEQLTNAPLVVLIDRGTAGAAEVLAGALRVHDRARLVADKREAAQSEAGEGEEENLVDPLEEETEQSGHTYGLAQVQAIVPLHFRVDDSKLSPERFVGSAIKITTAFYFLSNGHRIQSQGLTADHVVMQEPMPGWILDEVARPAFVQRVEEWLTQWREDDRAGLAAVAEFDGRNPEAWTGLTELLTDTDNMTPAEWARRHVRERARRLLAAEADGPEAARLRLDLQDDRPAFAAVTRALEAAGGTVNDVPAYRRLQER